MSTYVTNLFGKVEEWPWLFTKILYFEFLSTLQHCELNLNLSTVSEKNKISRYIFPDNDDYLFTSIKSTAQFRFIHLTCHRV